MKDEAILIFVEFYLPGYKSGGPLRTISSIVGACGDEFDFKLITMDRDAGDALPYSSVNINEWNEASGASIYYASCDNLSLLKLYRLVDDVDAEVFYLNSFFNFRFTILPLLIGIFVNKKILLCPRGEFSPGALSIKPLKKNIYLKLFKYLGLHNKVTWHATDDNEVRLIESIFGPVKVKKAIDVSLPTVSTKPLPPKSSCLKLVFLSRISHKKNVMGAIKSISNVSYPVVFDIYGPASRVEDKAYLKECQAFSESLPTHIQVNFKGEISHEEVGETLRNYDIFLLPTLGENFGHAILEALAAGLPLLIGNTTPWKNLSGYGIGWDLDPFDVKGFTEKIDEVAHMTVEKHSALRESALLYAKDYLESNESILQTRKMFSEVIQEA